MKILISENILKPKINIERVHIDNRWDEDIFTLYAKINDETVGELNYGVYKNEPNVKMLEIKENWRRMGIGTTLLKHLQKLYPNAEISLGFITNDGEKLLNTIKRKFIPNIEYNKFSTKLIKIEREIDRLIQKSNKGDYSENDKFNDLYDQKYELEDKLSDMKKGVWIIETN